MFGRTTPSSSTHALPEGGQLSPGPRSSASLRDRANVSKTAPRVGAASRHPFATGRQPRMDGQVGASAEHPPSARRSLKRRGAHRQRPAHCSAAAVPRSERRRPEQTVLYQVLEQHWPAFREHAEEAGGLCRAS